MLGERERTEHWERVLPFLNNSRSFTRRKDIFIDSFVDKIHAKDTDWPEDE